MRIDHRLIIPFVSALSLSCAGCGHDAESDPAGDAGADSGTDSGADADGGSYEDAGSPYQIGVGGFLTVAAENLGELLGFTAFAQFYDVSAPYVLHVPQEILVPADGVDTCALTYFDGSSGTAEGSLEWLTAGVVTVSSGPDAALLEEIPGGLVVNYWADLLALGLTPRYGEEYALSVTGDEAAAFEIDPVFVMPEAVEIVEPALDSLLPRAALPVAWTGDTPGDTVRVRLVAVDPASETSAKYEIACDAADDGGLEIPGEVMEALPAGWYAEVSVTRSRRAVHPIPADLDLIATASTRSASEHFLGD